MRIVIVACAAGKSDEAMQAQDLYTSDLFRKASALAKRMVANGEADAWFILSAKHGLIKPETIIEPYDVTLNAMTQEKYRAWHRNALLQLYSVGPTSIVALAGVNYRKVLADYVDDVAGTELVIPMEGLGIGQQLAWLKKSLIAA